MAKDDAKGGVCLKCGRSDPLNIRYCVFCGAALGDAKGFDGKTSGRTVKETAQKTSSPKVQEAKPPSPRKTGHGLAATGSVKPNEPKSPRKTITGLAAQTPTVPVRPMYFGSTPRPSLKMTALAVGAGIIVGLPIGILAGHTELSNFLAQESWPQQGLIVFADHPYANVSVADEKKQRFTVGECGPDGALSIADLPPGSYSIFLQAAGSKSYTQSLDLAPHKTTSIGYPSRIALTPQ